MAELGWFWMACWEALQEMDEICGEVCTRGAMLLLCRKMMKGVSGI
jgi:hypothetical protein